jgi:hypothetical protein
MSQSHQCQLNESLQQTVQLGDTISHRVVLTPVFPEEEMVNRPWGVPRDVCAEGLPRKARQPRSVSDSSEGTAASGEHELVIRAVT